MPWNLSVRLSRKIRQPNFRAFVVSCVFTLVAQSVLHWFALAAALIVGYWAVGAINRH